MRVVVIGIGNACYTLHLPALAGLAGVETVGRWISMQVTGTARPRGSRSRSLPTSIR